MTDAGCVGVGTTPPPYHGFSIGTQTSGTGEHIGLAVGTKIASGATTANGVYVQPVIQGALTNYRGFIAFPHSGAGSTVNDYGFFVPPNYAKATGNNWGFVSAIPDTAPGGYNFRASGTAPNYFAGQVQVNVGTAASPSVAFISD